ncbi:MAG TPA: YihY/virulence factor BrkB family protein [Thermomicrobiales bacterium]|jgi:membrane protein
MHRLRPTRGRTSEPESSESPQLPDAVVPQTVPEPAPIPAGSPNTSDLDRTDPAIAKSLNPRVLLTELWHAFFRTGVTGLATQFAYSLFFATFPLLVLVMSLAALVEHFFHVPVADTLRDVVDNSAPAILQDLLRELVDRAISQADASSASIGAVVAILLAVWGASGAVGTLVGACSRAYGVRPARSFLIRRLINALLALVIVVLIVFAAVLFVYGEAIGRRLATLLGGGETETFLGVLRWALILGFTATALLTLYRIGPNLDLEFVWLLPGTAVATVLWLLILKGFSALLTITNPGDPYGLFGSLVVLLWLFYLTGVAFMLGTVVNAVVGLPYDTRRRADLARNPRKRLFCDDGREA